MRAGGRVAEEDGALAGARTPRETADGKAIVAGPIAADCAPRRPRKSHDSLPLENACSPFPRPSGPAAGRAYTGHLLATQGTQRTEGEGSRLLIPSASAGTSLKGRNTALAS